MAALTSANIATAAGLGVLLFEIIDDIRAFMREERATEIKNLLPPGLTIDVEKIVEQARALPKEKEAVRIGCAALAKRFPILQQIGEEGNLAIGIGPWYIRGRGIDNRMEKTAPKKPGDKNRGMPEVPPGPIGPSTAGAAEQNKS